MHRIAAAALACVAVWTAPLAGQGSTWTELTDKIKQSEARLGRGAVEIDRVSGALYILGKHGVHCSEDGGQHWKPFSGEAVVGAYWYAAALTMDPAGGGRLAAFMKDPPEDPYASAMTLDSGKTWRPITRIKTNRKLHSYGWSWGLADWSRKEPTFLLARMHHSRRIWRSQDAGKTWQELPVQTRYMGMLDAKNLVVCNERTHQAYHSSDAGKTWQETAKLETTAFLPAAWKGRLYWVVRDGVVRSQDGGKTWAQLPGKLDKLYWGPVFGKTDEDMIVAGLDGVYRSRDGGKSWKRIAENHAVTIEKGFEDGKVRMDWFVGETDWAWDVKRDRLYLAVPGRLFYLDLAGENSN
jgi:photosystem II stability/assembly factor-like uncharacterized protein